LLALGGFRAPPSARDQPRTGRRRDRAPARCVKPTGHTITLPFPARDR